MRSLTVLLVALFVVWFVVVVVCFFFGDLSLQRCWPDDPQPFQTFFEAGRAHDLFGGGALCILFHPWRGQVSGDRTLKFPRRHDALLTPAPSSSLSPHEGYRARGLRHCRCHRSTKDTGHMGARPVPSSSLLLHEGDRARSLRHHHRHHRTNVMGRTACAAVVVVATCSTWHRGSAAPLLLLLLLPPHEGDGLVAEAATLAVAEGNDSGRR